MVHGISDEGITDIQTIKSKFNIEKVIRGNIFFNVGDGELRDRYTKLAERYREKVGSRTYLSSVIDGLASCEIDNLPEEGKRVITQIGRDEFESLQREARALLSIVREHFAPILEGLEPNSVENRNGRLFSSNRDIVYYGVDLELYGEGFLTAHKPGDTLVAIVTSGFNLKDKIEEGHRKANWPLRLYDAEQRQEPYADYDIHHILMSTLLLTSSTNRTIEIVSPMLMHVLSKGKSFRHPAIDMSTGGMRISTMPLIDSEIEGGIAGVVREYEQLASWVKDELFNPNNEPKIKHLHHAMCLYRLLQDSMTANIFSEGAYRGNRRDIETSSSESERNYGKVRLNPKVTRIGDMPRPHCAPLVDVTLAVENYLKKAIEKGREIINHSKALKNIPYFTREQPYKLR
ncbi:hypothetical protein HY636_03820 [Candidatus Woesearchaeota archaeon]|nr:hypothetical protein [Candidatus Woesearchaeota archaeon]